MPVALRRNTVGVLGPRLLPTLWTLGGGVTPPPPTPEVSSAVVAADGLSLSVTFNTAVTGSTDGFSLLVGGAPRALDGLLRDDAHTMRFVLRHKLYITDDTVFLVYTAGNIANTALVPMAAFSNVSVTNDSTVKRGPRPAFIQETQSPGTGHAHIAGAPHPARNRGGGRR
jgi:hypothetical protein